MKKLISILVVLLMSIGILPGTVASETDSELPFKDVPASAWYYESVKTAYGEGIMNGKANDIFDPTANITRAEFVAVLCRLSATEYVGLASEISFSDTDKGAWYADYIGWASKNELVKGYTDNTFRPNDYITRQEMGELLGRFVSFKLIRSPGTPKIDSFADVEEIPQWASANIEKMRAYGILSGDENGNFNPTAKATRAELAKIAAEVSPLVSANDRYKRFRFDKAFGYSDETAPLPYRIYIPDDYDETKKYPLLIFLHGNSAQGDDNEKHYSCVKNAFLSPYSPVLESIVVVPQCPEGMWWHKTDGTIDLLAELMDYINERYSTDSARQYVSGISMGGDGSWQMAIHYPEKVSAIMPVAGIGFTFYKDETGEHLYENNPKSFEVNIRIIYDRDDGFSDRTYNQMVYNALLQAGATNITYHETTGLGHGVCGAYAGYNDVSHLVWLYSQVKETAK